MTDFVYDKAEGHPLFSEELAYALRDTGLITIQDGKAEIAPNTASLDQLDLPNTLQGLITSRIDRLLPPQQLLLKAASVIGRSFTYRLLHEIYPLAADKTHLRDYLNRLYQLELLILETPDPSLAYLFRHIMTQEVAYHLMSFAQRRELHRAIAQWYEHTQAADLSPLYGLLAYHWGRAEERLKTLEYLDKAGEQALQGGAYQEAAAFFTQALAWVADQPPGNRLQQSRWHRQLGTAYLGLGQLEDSVQQLQAAVALLQAPMATSSRGLLLPLAGQVLRQLWHRVSPDRPSITSVTQQRTYLELTRSYITLGEVCHYAQHLTLGTYATLAGLNLAETVQPSPELARIYANMCFAMGVNRLHCLAQQYGDLAEQTIQNIALSRPCIGWVCMVTGVYKSSLGAWQLARNTLQRSIQVCRQLGDRHQLAQGLAGIALVDHCQGNFDAALDLWQQTYTLGESYGDIQAQAWGLLGQVEEYLCLGDLEPAQPLLETAHTLLEDQDTLVAEQIRLKGVSALMYLRRDERILAQQDAAAALACILQAPPVALYVLEGYGSVVEVYLQLWQAEAASRPLRPSLQLRQACTAMHHYAQAFAIGQPRALLWKGVAAWLQGQPRVAQHRWRKALTHAQQLGMPYEQGRIHAQWGQHLESKDPERQWHLEQAHQIFTQLGVTSYRSMLSAHR